MNVYSLQITTVAGVADSEFLDRLAALVYAIDDLANVAMGLNDDASVTASFDVQGIDPLSAADRAVRVFVDAIERAKPLSFDAMPVLDGFSVATAAGRALATA